MYTVRIEGLQQAIDLAGGFSARRVAAMGATIVTRLARAAEREWTGDIFANIDRPISKTLNAALVKPASAASPVAALLIKDAPGAGGLAPVQWMAPHEDQGGRITKKFETGLMHQGAMPRGMKVVPGPAAQLDGYGNISRGQIVAVLNQLGSDLSPGYQRVISKSGARRLARMVKHGRTYVAITKQQGKNRPGIYEKQGDALRLVFVFVGRVNYRKRTNFAALAQQVAETQAGPIATQTFLEHLARIQAKGAAA